MSEVVVGGCFPFAIFHFIHSFTEGVFIKTLDMRHVQL